MIHCDYISPSPLWSVSGHQHDNRCPVFRAASPRHFNTACELRRLCFVAMWVNGLLGCASSSTQLLLLPTLSHSQVSSVMRGWGCSSKAHDSNSAAAPPGEPPRMWVIAHKNLGLPPQIHGTENRGMSVQLLGNKYGEDNSGRQISGLGGERQQQQKKRGKAVAEDGVL